MGGQLRLSFLSFVRAQCVRGHEKGVHAKCARPRLWQQAFLWNRYLVEAVLGLCEFYSLSGVVVVVVVVFVVVVVVVAVCIEICLIFMRF